jgi:hypothetical protein
MQNVIFGIMTMGGVGSICDWVLFQKIKLGNRVMKDKFLLYKLIGDVAYPIRPWFYSPFKDAKDGLPRYKTHWNFIQSSTRMLVERVFGILKGRFRILLKRIDITLCHMPNLVTTCICLHNMCIANLHMFT